MLRAFAGYQWLSASLGDNRHRDAWGHIDPKRIRNEVVKIEETNENANDAPAGGLTPSDVEEGGQAPSLLQKSIAVAERLEAANKKQEELLLRQERIMAENLLGGTVNAGQKPVKKELSDKEYAEKVLAGGLSGQE